uniref:uncharacterized protein LOC122598449 n=1 Tax=Erigeron canadensis TaxID=72917 RepID=UPI001CB959F6|nr:uncharacterized protein LOC122598449 [Erigeron canadensis]
MPSRRKEMAGRTTDSFHDHGREIAIQYMSWQDDNFRRWTIMEKSLSETRKQVTMLKRQCRRYEDRNGTFAFGHQVEDLKTEFQIEKQRNDMVDAELDRERGKIWDLVKLAEDWKEKHDNSQKKIEELMLEFSEKEKCYLNEVRELKEKVGKLAGEKRAVLEAVPEFVRKLHSSLEFNLAMAEVQKFVVRLGAHCNLEKLHARNSKLDITKFEGYNPGIISELQNAGEKFRKKTYAYLTQLASSSGLSAEDLLKIPAPEATPTSFSAPAPSTS